MLSRKAFAIKGFEFIYRCNSTLASYQCKGAVMVRPTGLEPVPIAGHAPQTCAYANSATVA